MNHVQSVVVFYGLACVYQLAQLKIDVTGEMEVEITGGAAKRGRIQADQRGSSSWPRRTSWSKIKSDVAVEAEIGIGL